MTCPTLPLMRLYGAPCSTHASARPIITTFRAHNAPRLCRVGCKSDDHPLLVPQPHPLSLLTQPQCAADSSATAAPEAAQPTSEDTPSSVNGVSTTTTSSSNGSASVADATPVPDIELEAEVVTAISKVLSYPCRVWNSNVLCVIHQVLLLKAVFLIM